MSFELRNSNPIPETHKPIYVFLNGRCIGDITADGYGDDLVYMAKIEVGSNLRKYDCHAYGGGKTPEEAVIGAFEQTRKRENDFLAALDALEMEMLGNVCAYCGKPFTTESSSEVGEVTPNGDHFQYHHDCWIKFEEERRDCREDDDLDDQQY